MPDKWTIAQYIDHLTKSIQPINKALNMPKLALRTMFGKCKREEMIYETLFKNYKATLAEGGKASKTFVPTTTPFEKEKSAQKLESVMANLIDNINKWKEPKLSVYQLPHPLLGKLSVREIVV